MKTQQAMAIPALVPVSADNFNRAESDLNFGLTVKQGGFGKFIHIREPVPVDQQTVTRSNRDMLYSTGVFDLDVGPVTITLPDAGRRFISMQMIDQDHYCPGIVYIGGGYTLRKEKIGTRYVLVAVRVLVDPLNQEDIKQVHAFQDAIRVKQPGSHGRFEVPNWDLESQKRMREGLLLIATTMPDTRNMFGTRGEVDPVRHLIGTAMGWGGIPEKDAFYFNVTSKKNDGKIVHKLTVKDVPVDGFWSISLYNEKGYFEPNDREVYSINNITAKRNTNGSFTIQFGGYDGKTNNCLPIMPGWNYIVRLYRPRKEILDGTWKFPEAQPMI